MYLANLSHQIIYLKFQQPFFFWKINDSWWEIWWLLCASWITIYLISYPISYPMIRPRLVVFIHSYLISTYFYEKDWSYSCFLAFLLIRNILEKYFVSYITDLPNLHDNFEWQWDVSIRWKNQRMQSFTK